MYIQVHTSTIFHVHTHTKVTTTFHFKSGLIRLATPASFPTTLELSLACSIHPLSSLLDCQTNQAWLYWYILVYIYTHTGIYMYTLVYTPLYIIHTCMSKYIPVFHCMLVNQF
jgi:hypothetical protein